MVDASGQLPAELRAFLHTCVDSITQVELLMMLRGSDRFRPARDVATDLGTAAAPTRRDLEILAARGLLEVHVGEETAYRYRPKSEDLARYGDLLAQHYITSRPAVLGFVATESRLAAKRFANAFRILETD